MIKFLNREAINIEKYNTTINNSSNSIIYAFSWYLDEVCNDWGALVSGDYKAVMPLPKKKKYGLEYIYIPPFVQQLGIFSIIKIDSQLVHSFFKAIPKNFILVDTVLNSQNTIESSDVLVRNNYILNLNSSYKNIVNNYSKGRKSSLKQSENFGLRIEIAENCESIIKLSKNNEGFELKADNYNFSILKRLISSLRKQDKAFIYEVKNLDDEQIGGAIFLKSNHRIIYLFSVISKEGRDKQAMTLLINHIIKENSNSDFTLDFEGSMIDSIAFFFKSFGSTKEEYYHYKKYLNFF